MSRLCSPTARSSSTSSSTPSTLPSYGASASWATRPPNESVNDSIVIANCLMAPFNE